MRELTDVEREFLKNLIKLKPQKKPSGYYYYRYNKNKNTKRSRVLMQLHLNKKLEQWEIVHHKDENRGNDLLENLEIIDTKEFNYHTSHHFAGKRNRKTTKGDFYLK